MSFLILLIGFAFLIKGADVFVEGCSALAENFNVPPMIIGLTIVAMGTSAPEAAVSITSSLAGQNDISIANVVGSNFFNILIVLGVSSIIAKLPVKEITIKKDTPFLVLISSLLVLLCSNLTLDKIDGLVLLILFFYFLYYTTKSTTRINNFEDEFIYHDESALAIEISNKISIPKTIIYCIIGAIGIIIGGDMVVSSATSIASDFGMSDNLVGLTIVAMGTSLPEFATSIVAIKKGETDIAIGNVIGSNLFNILLVLGLSSFINPITVSTIAFIDIIFMTIITILLYLFMKRSKILERRHGIILFIIYIIYIGYTIIR